MLRELLSTCIADATLWNCRTRHHTGGTALPGSRALRICPDILKRTSASVKTIIVTGTNGKSTTVRMITGGLESLGLPYFANTEGGNTEIAITTTFVTKHGYFSRSRECYAVIECDELYLEKMCRILTPITIVFTNISSDQTERLGTEEHIRNIFRKVSEETSAALCINMDCPNTASIINEKIASRVIPYSVKDRNIYIKNKEYAVDLPLPGRYNWYNAAAGAAVIESLHKLSKETILALQKVQLPYGRMEKFLLDQVPVTINLAKNPAGVNLNLAFLQEAPAKYHLIMGMNNNVEDGRDLTWFQEISVEKYPALFSSVTVWGNSADALAARLKQAGIQGIRYVETPDELLSEIRSSKLPVFLLLNYTCMMYTRNIFARRGYIDDFWKK